MLYQFLKKNQIFKTKDIILSDYQVNSVNFSSLSRLCPLLSPEPNN